ncbi:Rop family plasmid primer RNA-binding protein, partial [Salmonella enterica]
MTASCFHIKIITRHGKTHMNRQESAVLNMAKFIRAQTLLLLERIDLLDFDDEATDCEQLHEQAEALYRKLS